MWIEGNVALSFLLHIDRGEPSTFTNTPPPPPSARLRGYRHAPAGVPADAALVITNGPRELQLHCELAAAPLPLTVAATTRTRLPQADSPADKIWTVGSAPGSCLPSLMSVSATPRRQAIASIKPQKLDGRTDLSTSCRRILSNARTAFPRST
jgi:hypothetical protein